MDGDNSSQSTQMSEEKICNVTKMRIVEISQPRVRDLVSTLENYKDIFPPEKQKRLLAKINDLKLMTAEDLQKEVSTRNDLIRKQNKKANKEMILIKLEKNIQRQTLNQIYRIILKIVPEVILNPVPVDKTALMRNLINAVYRNMCEINCYPHNLHYFNIYFNLSRYIANSMKEILDKITEDAVKEAAATTPAATTEERPPATKPKRKSKCITNNCRRMCEIKRVASKITSAKQELLGL